MRIVDVIRDDSRFPLLESQIYDQLWGHYYGPLYRQLRIWLGDPLYEQLWGQLRRPVRRTAQRPDQ